MKNNKDVGGEGNKKIKAALKDLQKSVDDLGKKGISLSISFGDEEVKLEPTDPTTLK